MNICEQAEKEALALGECFIGTVHLLLALLSENNLKQIIEVYGISVENVRERARSYAVPGNFIPVELPFTPKLKKIIEAATTIGRESKTHGPSPEQLFLSLLTEETSAAKILKELGVDTVELESQLLTLVYNGKR